jgi:hypothetical protein
MLEKACSKCKLVLPADRFNKAKWLKTGLRPDCKDCYSKAKKEYWAKRPKSDVAIRRAENARLAKDDLRRCVTCSEIKPRDDEHFALARGRPLPTCRECDRKRVREWAESNAERYKASAAAGWAQRYAAKQQRTIQLTAEHKQQLKEIYAECRERNRNSPRAWHVDHIVPLNGKTVSGLHVPWNLQIIPGSANVRKSNKVSESY